MSSGEQTAKSVGRRGILAAGAAVVAGIMAKQAAQPVAASTAFLIANTETGGISNSTVGGSVLISSSSYTSGLGVLIGDSGLGAARAGVLGTTIGSYVPSELCGVSGISGSFTSVYGNALGSGTAVKGVSNTGIGVYGVSSGSYGILGTTTAAGVYSGVTGSITTATGAAFAGGASQASAFAAYFTGKVNIDGPFLVNGSQRFTLKHSDGTSRLVASVQSPEAWVEDFGKGALVNGHADVKLDADFAAIAETGDYHVFLTPYGTVGGLRVAAVRPDGFAVEEIGGASSGTFSWRAVARPKDGGGKVARLAKYEQPNIKIPGINDLPKPAEGRDQRVANPAISPQPVAAPQPPAPQPRAASGGSDAAPAAPASQSQPSTTTLPAPQPAPPSRP